MPVAKAAAEEGADEAAAEETAAAEDTAAAEVLRDTRQRGAKGVDKLTQARWTPRRRC